MIKILESEHAVYEEFGNYRHKSDEELLNEVWEIPESMYEEMFEVLPPLAMGRDWFVMCEFLRGSITSIYVRFGKKYYHSYITIRRSDNIKVVAGTKIIKIAEILTEEIQNEIR